MKMESEDEGGRVRLGLGLRSSPPGGGAGFLFPNMFKDFCPNII